MAAGYGMVPLNHGQMRSSQADRERAVDVLKAAFAEGRLDQDEYTERVGRAYSSRTYAELATLTADLPVGPLGTLPPQPSRQPEAVLSPRVLARPRRRRNPLLVIVLMLLVLAAFSQGLAGAIDLLPFIVIVAILTRIFR